MTQASSIIDVQTCLAVLAIQDLAWVLAREQMLSTKTSTWAQSGYLTCLGYYGIVLLYVLEKSCSVTYSHLGNIIILLQLTLM